MSVKNATVLIKAKKAQKKELNFEKVVSGRLLISLTANRNRIDTPTTTHNPAFK
jgi:hypothetical protein